MSISEVHPRGFQYQLGLFLWKNCVVATLLCFKQSGIKIFIQQARSSPVSH